MKSAARDNPPILGNSLRTSSTVPGSLDDPIQLGDCRFSGNSFVGQAFSLPVSSGKQHDRDDIGRLKPTLRLIGQSPRAVGEVDGKLDGVVTENMGQSNQAV